MVNETNKTYNDYKTQKANFELQIKKIKDEQYKIELEKNIIESSISIQQKEIKELSQLVFNKLPNEFSSFQFLYKKENEINEKIKLEKKNSEYNNSNEIIMKEIQGIIDLYKEVSGINIAKTKEGLLQITIFPNVPLTVDQCYILIEIVDNKYKIVGINPVFKFNEYEDALNNNKNFTLFLASIIVKEFCKYLK